MRKSSAIAVVVSAFLIPFFTLQAQAQDPSSGTGNPSPTQNRSTISGFVFDQQRRPIAEIPVELLSDVNLVLRRTKTNGSGRFFFSQLSQGRFSIRVLTFKTEFEEQSQDVEIYGVGFGGRALADNVQKDIYLRLRKEATTSSHSPGAIFVQEVPAEAKQVYAQAILDFDGNRLEAGIEGLEKALRLFPTYYLALEKLGLAYTNQQKYERAREIFGKAVEVNTRSFNGWYGLSYVNYALRQPEAAIEAAQKAVSLNSSSNNALLFLGLSLRQAKRYEEAERSLKRADALAKGLSPEVHWNLALLYAHNLKRYKDAANELELYLKTHPGTSQADNIKKLIKLYRENPPANVRTNFSQ
jgi:tetratricopeptide (TPR) repeat protein